MLSFCLEKYVLADFCLCRQGRENIAQNRKSRLISNRGKAALLSERNIFRA